MDGRGRETDPGSDDINRRQQHEAAGVAHTIKVFRGGLWVARYDLHSYGGVQGGEALFSPLGGLVSPCPGNHLTGHLEGLELDPEPAPIIAC